MPIRRFFLDQFPWLHFISISILLTLSGDYWTIWAFPCFCRERSLGNTDHCFTVYKNSITGKKKLIFHWTIFIFKTSWRETWNYTLLFIQSYLAAFMSGGSGVGWYLKKRPISIYLNLNWALRLLEMWQKN